MAEAYGDAVQRVTFNHWAVGWVAEIAYDVGRPDVASYVETVRERLDGYPVLDEDDWSNLEWEDNHPDGTRECYADPSDECPCRYATLLRMVRRVAR
jgi:hypothetical protein